MRPFFDPRAARACMMLGLLAAICSLTINAQSAPAERVRAHTLTSTALTPFHGVQWAPIDSPRTRRLFAPAAPSHTALLLAEMTRAGDRIARLPYTWGGGHGSFDSTGYDCSGSVSYVLHAAGLLSTPQDSSGLESFGAAGPGRHVTIYANAQHALMVIDGRRFDTIALQETGTRWSSSVGSTSGYTVRHPAGL